MQLFTKYNETRFKDSLLQEADGLELLADHLKDNPLLLVPKVVNVDKHRLQTQKILQVRPTKKHFEDLGKGFVQLHKKCFKKYGYDKNNYIGLNPQKNILSDEWGEFFTEYRLGFQISLIKDVNVRKRFQENLETNKQKLEDFLNEHTKHPSLVHGDLWSGNVLYDTEKVWLIDPAVYYGDREVDIAMSEMFGGFGSSFYESYEKEYPKSKQYSTKKIIYNLYHYLNHYNLFGSGYLSGCENGFEIIERL